MPNPKPTFEQFADLLQQHGVVDGPSEGLAVVYKTLFPEPMAAEQHLKKTVDAFLASLEEGHMTPVTTTVTAYPSWGAETGIPLYQSHKVLRAFKIGSIVLVEGGYRLVAEEPADLSVVVGSDYFDKHLPRTGDYYVLYQDDYASRSPADAFESGYTRIYSRIERRQA